MTTPIPFQIERKTLVRYTRFTNAIGYGILGFMLWIPVMLITLAEAANPGFWALVHTAWMLIFALLSWLGVLWYTRKAADALGYELDGDTLRIRQGVFNWQRKAIPLDRVTDIMLSQGIIMRRFGLWQVDLQTASQAGMGAEGTLLGIGDPKHVRDTLLAARNVAVKS